MKLYKIGWLCIVLTLIAGLLHAVPVNAAAAWTAFRCQREAP
ncbi:hypothetical protein P4K96_23080 [Bacillus cereus]|nr:MULTISPECIES: hypothetical protein [Paenibacillus]MEB9896329.1 hypothetical protein [Bacillus cereus]